MYCEYIEHYIYNMCVYYILYTHVSSPLILRLKMLEAHYSREFTELIVCIQNILQDMTNKRFKLPPKVGNLENMAI
jgi:hypothetical protein